MAARATLVFLNRFGCGGVFLSANAFVSGGGTSQGHVHFFDNFRGKKRAKRPGTPRRLHGSLPMAPPSTAQLPPASSTPPLVSNVEYTWFQTADEVTLEMPVRSRCMVLCAPCVVRKDGGGEVERWHKDGANHSMLSFTSSPPRGVACGCCSCTIRSPLDRDATASFPATRARCRSPPPSPMTGAG